MIDTYLKFLEEGYIFSDKNISVNLNDFVNGDKNKLLILGPSGAGKSTLGLGMARKYKVPLLQTDGTDRKQIFESLRNSKRMIIEGIDLFPIYQTRKNLLLSQSMIILGMSAIRSGLRSGIRNIGKEAPGIFNLTKTNIKYLEPTIKKIREDVAKLPNVEIKEFKY